MGGTFNWANNKPNCTRPGLHSNLNLKLSGPPGRPGNGPIKNRPGCHLRAGLPGCFSSALHCAGAWWPCPRQPEPQRASRANKPRRVRRRASLASRGRPGRPGCFAGIPPAAWWDARSPLACLTPAWEAGLGRPGAGGALFSLPAAPHGSGLGPEAAPAASAQCHSPRADPFPPHATKNKHSDWRAHWLPYLPPNLATHEPTLGGLSG